MIRDDEWGSANHRTLLHERIMRLLAHRVIRGLDTKQPLNLTEAKISSQFKVSRTVVREATKILAAKGLIEVRPRRGIRANRKSKWHLTDPDVLGWLSEAKPNHQFVRELCEVRWALEPAAAELAAMRARQHEVEKILEWYHRMENARQHTRKFTEADFHFHAAIWSACHNDLMEQLTATLRAIFRSSIAVTINVPGGLDPAIRLHERVADAISRHDPHEARRSMEDLLNKTIADITGLLQCSKNV